MSPLPTLLGMVLRKIFSIFFNTDKKPFALAIVAGTMKNTQSASLKFRNEFSRFGCFDVMGGGGFQGKRIFSSKCPEYININFEFNQHPLNPLVIVVPV